MKAVNQKRIYKKYLDKQVHISLESTGHFSKLFLDYINQEKNLSSFYKYSPSINSFEQAIKDISSLKFNRKLLVEVINEQYSSSELQTPNSELFLDEKTFTVCTGHQLCLFTGPLYFIYKIISTITLANELKKKYPAYNFVPLYWMASEDHDFEEVNHINLFGKKLEWKKKSGGAVGKFSTEGLSIVLDELKTMFDAGDNSKQLLKLFSDAYLGHRNYADATRFLVNELFSKYGLVILDADDKRLKNDFKEIIRDDIFNHSNFKNINETISSLKECGYEAQVTPREINFFLLSKKFRGWIDKAKVQSEPEEWKKKLEEETQRFSPSVVTRSLYQQKILPNLAYVGGPAEIAYWLEYKKMFEHHKIFFPVLIPRNFVHLKAESDSDENIFSGELQERHENFIPFYLKYGNKFFEELKRNLNPFDFRFNILSE